MIGSPLEIDLLKELLAKKTVTTDEKRVAVEFLRVGGLSTYRACVLVSLAPATFRYQAHPEDDNELTAQVRALANRYPRYGYRRIIALIRQRGRVNHKRVRRVWREQQLQVKRICRLRPKRSRPAGLQATYPAQIWAYDFVEDALVSGTPLKVLTVINEFTREGLALDVALSTSPERVIGVLAVLFAEYGAPRYLRSDNGAEFVALAVQRWLRENRVQTLYIEPGKPWQNGKEERFNGTHDECLNRYVFGSLAEAHVRLNQYRLEYNRERPHSSLGYLTPHAFRAAWIEAQQKLADPLIRT